MNCQVGIDEFGTATQLAEGWTIVSLADAEAATLTARAPALLGRGLTKFHGKEFTRKSADHYRAFLVLLKECCRAGPGGFIACTLNDKSWQAEFTAFADRVLTNTLLAAAPLDAPALAALRKIVPPLFTYLRVAAPVGGEVTASIALDEGSTTANFNDATVAVGGVTFTLPHLASMLFRAYRGQCFPKAPQVARDEIRVCPDDESFLVQAADVVGNFSTAYVFSQLGKRSKANDLKAAIFHDVFSECGIDDFDHAAKVEMVGDDLRLKTPGAYTLLVS